MVAQSCIRIRVKAPFNRDLFVHTVFENIGRTLDDFVDADGCRVSLAFMAEGQQLCG